MSYSTFTPITARRVLCRVQPLIEEMQQLYLALERMNDRPPGPEQRVAPRYLQGVAALHASFRALKRQGIRVADARRGRVGFPARRAGRTVWLCWQVGEPALSHWRESPASGSVRIPLDDDGPWEGPGAG
jgi:hypothetical protein